MIFSAADLAPGLSNPDGLAVADIDGDGWSDVVASGLSANKVVWYRNNGDGTFASVQYIVTTLPGTATFSNVAVADLNIDGRPDVIYWDGTSIRWSPNLGGSNPAAQFGYNSANVTANQYLVAVAPVGVETRVAAADLNGDGRPDVLTISAYPDNTLAWVPNLVNGFGVLAAVSTAGQDPFSVQGVDLDQDGWRDLLVASVRDNSVSWFKNLGGGSFGPRQFISNAGIPRARSAGVGDLNGDGRLDVVCIGTPDATTTVRWFAQNAPGITPRFGSANSVTQVVNGGYMSIARDLNSDGKQDVVVAASSTNQVFWCANSGGGNFGVATSNQSLIGGLSNPFAVETADFDQNGTTDVVASAIGGAKLTVYRNLGGQTAMTTADTAPATLVEGRRDDALRIVVSNKGVAGDSAARLDSLSLRFESSPGVLLNTAQANALLDKVAVHLDADSSGTFDPASDPAVATVTQLALTNGVLSFPFTGSAPADIQVAPGAARTYFVVLKIAEFAALQTPNVVRVSHVSHGAGRSVVKDAATSAVLTIESAAIVNAPSAFITAQPAHIYTDYAHLYFDSATAPGTGPVDDFDFDGNANLAEFGFGMDPTVSGSANIAVSGGVLVQRGLPVALATNTPTGVTFQAIFGRRIDALAGLTYTVQFSANLTTWVSSTATPTVLASDGVIEAVAVPYPLFVAGRKARFFRVQVTAP